MPWWLGGAETCLAVVPHFLCCDCHRPPQVWPVLDLLHKPANVQWITLEFNQYLGVPICVFFGQYPLNVQASTLSCSLPMMYNEESGWDSVLTLSRVALLVPSLSFPICLFFVYFFQSMLCSCQCTKIYNKTGKRDKFYLKVNYLYSRGLVPSSDAYLSSRLYTRLDR